MKKIYTILLLIAVSTATLSAQNSKTKKADQLYERLLYTEAAEAYQKLIERGHGDRYVFGQLANSYYFINDTKKAEPFYKRVVKGRNVNAETIYRYAQTLKANGKYSEHNTWMQKFAEMKPEDSRATDFLKNPNYIPKIMEEQARFTAANLEEINTKYSDFGAAKAGNDFYFASARNTSRKEYGWNEQPYLDIYKANNVGGTIKNANLLEGEVNTKYHEGAVAITADGKKMYFDRNDYYEGKYEKSEEGINQINLYSAEYVTGEWKDVQSLTFNSSEYSTGHPALSPDGKTLYFTSDRPGGQGMSDIYKVAIKTDGSFGTPENLGSGINTEGKEVFPFVDSNGTLYFSSDGHLGIGGLDVFYAEAGGSGFDTVTNMGLGVNSASDDFAFSFDPANLEGYVSSDRQGGKGSDDIYKIKELDICEVTIAVTVVNEMNKAPIPGARVELYDAFENKLSVKTADEKGQVSFLAECDKKHVVQAYMQDFESNASTVDPTDDETVSSVVTLSPIEELIVEDKVVLNPILFDLDKHNIKPQAAFELDKLVVLMKKYPDMIIKVESHTDNRASDAYNLDLSDRRAKSTVQYVISKGINKSRISGEGFGESRPAVDCGENCTEAQHQQNRRSEFIIVKR